jgi:hypothetical protein
LVGRLKDQREDRTAAGIVDDPDAPVVRLHDLTHDGKAQSSAMSRAILAAPETIEDLLGTSTLHPWFGCDRWSYRAHRACLCPGAGPIA